MLRVPSGITMDQLVQQISRELGTNIGSATQWKLWKGYQMTAPPLTEGEEYGLVPRELATGASLEPIKKRDIDFTKEIRRHGRMVTVTVEITKVQQKVKVPPEVTLSPLIRTHVATTPLPAESVLSWVKITGRGAAGRLQEGDMVEIKTGNQELSKCFVSRGWGEFAEPFEMDINAREEPEVLAEANELNPAIGANAQYYQGLERLPRLMPVRGLLIFPQDIERPQFDSPAFTGLSAERMRTVRPMKKIRWVLIGSKGKKLSQSQEATIPEDAQLVQLWSQVAKTKIPVIESSEVAWWRQFRNGHEIWYGPPITIQEGDLLHIEVKEQKKIALKGKKQRNCFKGR
jgi:hypothetical protein